jgi:membrane protease YdiL (CAAX protease family)
VTAVIFVRLRLKFGGENLILILRMYTLFVFGSLGLTAALAWVTYQSGRLLRSVPVHENLLLAPVENMVKGVLVLICIGLGVMSGATPEQLGWTLQNFWRDLGLGLIIGLLTQLAANGLTLAAIKRWGKGIYSPIVMKNIMPRTRIEWVLVPAALLLAVVLEELLFRSLLIGGLSQTVPLPILVIGFSAIFGLMHSPQGSLGVVMTGVLGAWLGLLFIWSGGLLLPLTTHYVINFLQLLKAQDERAWLDTY